MKDRRDFLRLASTAIPVAAGLFTPLARIAASPAETRSFFGTDIWEVDCPSGWAVESEGPMFLFIRNSQDSIPGKDGRIVLRGAMVAEMPKGASHRNAKSVVNNAYPRYRQTGPDWRDSGWKNLKDVTTSSYSAGAIPYPGELYLSTAPAPNGELLFCLLIFDGPSQSPIGIAESGELFRELRESFIETLRFAKPQPVPRC